MKAEKCTGADDQTLTLVCRNCGHAVTIKAGSDRASCSHCSNVWNPLKAPIRGQR